MLTSTRFLGLPAWPACARAHTHTHTHACVCAATRRTHRCAQCAKTASLTLGRAVCGAGCPGSSTPGREPGPQALVLTPRSPVAARDPPAGPGAQTGPLGSRSQGRALVGRTGLPGVAGWRRQRGSSGASGPLFSGCGHRAGDQEEVRAPRPPDPRQGQGGRAGLSPCSGSPRPKAPSVLWTWGLRREDEDGATSQRGRRCLRSPSARSLGPGPARRHLCIGLGPARQRQACGGRAASRGPRRRLCRHLCTAAAPQAPLGPGGPFSAGKGRRPPPWKPFPVRTGAGPPGRSTALRSSPQHRVSGARRPA